MNINQKKKIIALRSEGKSYLEISQEMNIPKSTVKTIIRRGINDVQSCLNCGKDLIHIPGKKKKRFCCDECRWEWWHRHRSLYEAKKTAVCIFCGKTFAYFGKPRKYCSRSCYLRDRYGNK